MTSPTESGPIVAMLAATGREPDDFTTFMGALVEQSRRDYVHTTDTLIDSLATECAESAARLELIEEGIQALLDGPYAPSARAIGECLYPARRAMAERTAEILLRRGVHSSTHRQGEAS